MSSWSSRPTVGAGWDDLVDPVEDGVGEPHIQAGEEVVELLLGAAR